MLRQYTLRRFLRARGGLAAVEFALILPLMLMLFMGTVELSLAFAARTDVVNLTSTTADLVAQAKTVSTTDLQSVFAAANTILYPYDTGAATIILTSVTYSNTGANTTTGTVAWSQTNNGTPSPHPKGGNFTVPAGLFTNAAGSSATQSVIVSEVSYRYASPITKFLPSQIVWQNIFYSKPRRVDAVPCSC